MYRIEEYSLLINTYLPLKSKYKTEDEARQKMIEQKNKHPNRKYRIIKEDFINDNECKVTFVTDNKG